MEIKPFDKEAKVLGLALKSSIMSLPAFTQKNMFQLLKTIGIEELNVKTWYDMGAIAKFYSQIIKDFGPNTMFELGKSIPENASFPPEVDNIEAGLQAINAAYGTHHQGYVGFYKVVEHDIASKKIIMQCYNPYPCSFDKGVITAMARKFQMGVRVDLDKTKPYKDNGGNESWYIITYR